MKLHRTIVLFAGGALLAIGAAAAGSAWEGLERLPERDPIRVVVEGKSRNYFRVTPKSPLTIKVKGPARLRIVSRAELPSGTNEKVAYSVQVTEGKRVLESQRMETELSTEARPAQGSDLVGQSRQMIVSIRKGPHTLKLSTEGERPILVRLLTSSAGGGRARTVSLAPVDAARSLSLQEGEKNIPYYSALPGKPVRFRIVGPTTLEVLCRLDYDQTMRGTQSYRLRITDGSKRPREVEFKTTKALTATWAEMPDLLPSKFRRMELPVAEGTHDVSVELIKPETGSVEIHARIPEPAVGNTE